MIRRISGVAAVALWLIPALAQAQGSTGMGAIAGVVKDASGAVIPGVSLVLRNDATGVEVNRSSNPEGRYLFDYVDPGTYNDVTINTEGGSWTITINPG